MFDLEEGDSVGLRVVLFFFRWEEEGKSEAEFLGTKVNGQKPATAKFNLGKIGGRDEEGGDLGGVSAG